MTSTAIPSSRAERGVALSSFVFRVLHHSRVRYLKIFVFCGNIKLTVEFCSEMGKRTSEKTDDEIKRKIRRLEMELQYRKSPNVNSQHGGQFFLLILLKILTVYSVCVHTL